VEAPNESFKWAVNEAQIADECQFYCLERVYGGLSPDLIHGRYCMILQAYLDDSDKNGCYAVGGYIAPLPVWKRWIPLWHAELKQKSPKLEFFRTSDALAMRGAFKNFSDKNQRDARVLALAQTFPVDNFYGIEASLKRDEYDKYFLSKAPIKTLDPFYLCASYLVAHVNLHLLTNSTIPSKVDYFFDRQGKVGAHFVQVSDFAAYAFERQTCPFIGDFRFENKTEFLPLQAADMRVSWARRRAAEEPTTLVSDKILDEQRHLTYQVDREFLSMLVEPGRLKSAEQSILSYASDIISNSNSHE
jgi:hypothetical protein